ncbi:hypothetical protein [Pelagicoccus albus]|uniref:Uncharacterized protein n=1 Tax=Pelagicoccus albus TaxID=415222 RepID=A0A7X1B6K1_9BACT|nr:hypothetical protein [Pelagicoccus albus]MBC2606324.1 hypothetical protein [Pelagicoccus albus]
MSILALISSLASIVGLLIQVGDKFKEKRELRDKVIYTVYGLTAGTILGLVSGIEFRMEETLTLGSLVGLFLMVVMAVVIVICAIAYTKSNKTAGDEIYALSGLFCTLVIVGIFFTLRSDSQPTKSDRNDLSYYEHRILIDQLMKDGRYERAMEFTNNAAYWLDEDDVRMDKLTEIGLEIYNAMLERDGLPPVTLEEMRSRMEAANTIDLTTERVEEKEGKEDANQTDHTTPVSAPR